MSKSSSLFTLLSIFSLYLFLMGLVIWFSYWCQIRSRTIALGQWDCKRWYNPVMSEKSCKGGNERTETHDSATCCSPGPFSGRRNSFAFPSVLWGPCWTTSGYNNQIHHYEVFSSRVCADNSVQEDGSMNTVIKRVPSKMENA